MRSGEGFLARDVAKSFHDGLRRREEGVCSRVCSFGWCSVKVLECKNLERKRGML